MLTQLRFDCATCMLLPK